MKTSAPTKNESCASRRPASSGSRSRRMARATSMPSVLPPTEPMPIMRSRMARKSSSVRNRSTSEAMPERWTRSAQRTRRTISSRRSGRAAVLPAFLGHHLGLLEKAPPVSNPAVALQTRPLGPGKDLREHRAFLHGQEGIAMPHMDGVHRIARPVLHFQRAHIDPAVKAEHIEHELGCVADRLQRVERMVVPIKPEVGHRLEVEQPRAGEHERNCRGSGRSPSVSARAERQSKM